MTTLNGRIAIRATAIIGVAETSRTWNDKSAVMCKVYIKGGHVFKVHETYDDVISYWNNEEAV